MSASQLRNRYANQRVGALVLTAVGLLAIAMLQAGVLQDIFRSTSTLRVLLPEKGLSGLSAGAPVEVLGTKAGLVRRVVITTDENLHAVVQIEDAMKPFVRRDSKVSIRKQFGLAGAAYLDITRGSGAPLDWDYAVLTAESDSDAFGTIGLVLDSVQRKLLPMLDETGRAVSDLAAITSGIRRGEGSIGRMVADDTLAREAEATIVSVKQQLGQMSAIVDNLKATSVDVSSATRSLASQTQKLPAVMDNVNATLVSLNRVMQEAGKAMPEMTALARSSSNAAVALPAVLAQTQQTMSELQRLLAQLQGSWLLGGSGREPTSTMPRLSPVEARP